MTSPETGPAYDWARLQSNDKAVQDAALLALWQENGQNMYHLSLRMLRDLNLAEDAVQEAMHRFIVYLRRIKPRHTPRSYILAIARNVCLEWLRRKRPVLAPDVPEPVGGPVDDPPQTAIANERKEILRQALDGLPDWAREVLTLRYISGMRNEEIAEVLQMPRNTVDVRVYRALRLLEKKVLRKGL